jgi:EmrB/QacA subfamily drug resistance transporter
MVFLTTHVVMVLSSINNTAISVAFPIITEHYKTSLVMAGWVLSIYQLVGVCSMVVMSKVSDVFGRKQTFLACSGLFVVGSLCAAVAPSIQLLIAARFLQSAGGGGFLPIAVGIITESFPNPHHRHLTIGIGMSLFNVGGIIGPNIGAWLITAFGWQSIFWFNVPIGVASIIPLFFLLKKDTGKKVHIDYAGAGYFSAFLVTFMVGLSQIAHSENSAGWLSVGLLFAVSAIMLVVFIRHELKEKEPIVELDLLRRKAFASSNIYNFIYGICVFGFTALIPLFAVSVYHMTTTQSGYVMMTRAIGMIVASTVSGFFLIRWGYRKPMLLGSIIVSACLLMLAFRLSDVTILGIEVNTVVLICGIALIMGLGMGIAAPASNNACIDLLPQRASTISGVRGMFRQGGGAISIAVITMILQFVGNLSLGFNIVFICSGFIVLLTIPFIFAMPDRAAPVIARETA